MVDEITPTYYAEGGLQPYYTITGRGFHLLPYDALGIRAEFNDNPLENINSELISLYDIVERSDTRIVFAARREDGFSYRGYLGGIVSNDRTIVYWVNNSHPLPTNRGDIVEPEFIDER